MPSTASLAGMGDLADRLSDLSTIPSRAAGAVAEDLADLIDRQFSLGVDPYGKAWAPLRPFTIEKGRAWPPLTDTSDMRDGVDVRAARGAGVEITIPFPGGFHQGGWKHHWQGRRVPPRPILPSRGALPRAWRDAINRRVREAFGGRR